MNTKHALVSENEPIKSVIQIINIVPLQGGEPGIAVVIDENNKVLGVITDGDIRNAFCQEVDFSRPVHTVMSKNFVYVFDDLNPTEQFRSVLQQMSKHKKLNDPRMSKVIVCKRDMEFIDIVNLLELYKYGEITLRKIAVYGMGYVGLIVALTIAELNQFHVTGIDANKQLLKDLSLGIPPFYEKGLTSLLKHCIAKKAIDFKHSGEEIAADIHIVSVGTPVNNDKKPVYSFLEDAGRQIAKILKEGDMVICRSTVPVGTTRNILIPLLEAESGLIAGKDFFVAFAPERTIEGNALKEIKTLPQVIGGYSKQCKELAAKLFQKITSTIIQVNSLEAAEVVKLINNTYRDTVFSFANEVALMCDSYNLDAFEIIEAANEGYPRNPIPCPSPGVGGACLTKDPYLYLHHNISNSFHTLQLGRISRSINQKMPEYIFQKFKMTSGALSLKPEDTKIFIVGIAFKGFPETSDVRFSPTVELINLLKNEGYIIQGFDWVVSGDEMKKLGIVPASLEDGIKNSSAVFFMNNHPQNSKFDVYTSLVNCKKPFFFFDGWNIFSKQEIESIPGIIYATLGYCSKYES